MFQITAYEKGIAFLWTKSREHNEEKYQMFQVAF